jgi:uncharacterized membrane protein YebE (DUF533 family)
MGVVLHDRVRRGLSLLGVPVSDTVVLALIAMVQGWGDKLILNASTIATAIGGAVIAYMTWRNGQKAEAAKNVALETKHELTAQVAECKDAVCEVKDVAVRSHHEVTQAFMAGERGGYVNGIKEGRKQATGPQPLE